MSNTKIMTKIKLGFYPYTYVRVVTMKSKLLKKEDYDKLLKMKPGEIAQYLQEGDYRDEINQLAHDFVGADLVEQAITKNMVRNYAKLKRIATPELNILIQAYLRRADVYNIKTILRSKFAHLDNKATAMLPKPVGTYSEVFYQKLLGSEQAEGVEGVIKNLDLDEKKKEMLIKSYRETKSLIAFENFLDKQYFEFITTLCEQIPKEGELFKEFLMYEIDVLNIKLLLRLKVGNITPEDIRKNVCTPGKILNKNNLEKFVKLSKFDVDNILSELEKTELYKVIKPHHKEIAEQGILFNLEVALDTWLLKKATLLLHQHPLTIDTILGYLFAKELETRNLLVITKGKQLGLAEEFLGAQLIV